jgi:nucleoside-diphosphate kinase
VIERTFVMLKPDAVQRGLMGEIVGRLERKGYKAIAMKYMRIPRELAERHYGEHKGKGFFNGLIDYITSGPVLVMVWEGENIVADVRVIMGKTNPKDAMPGTIRGDLAPMRWSRPSTR